MATDFRVRAHALGGRRIAATGAQAQADRAGVAADLPTHVQLAEDLQLAQNHGIETCSATRMEWRTASWSR